MPPPGDKRAPKDNPRAGYGASDSVAGKTLAANLMALVACALLFGDDAEAEGDAE